MPRDVLTTRITAAATSDLTLLSTVATDWEITGAADNAFLALTISRCSAAAARFCNRKFQTFGIQTLQDVIALRRDRWPRPVTERPNVLQLSSWPVVAVESVMVDGTVYVEGTDFLTDAAVGQLVRISETSGSPKDWTGALITVVYQAGYLLPNDVAANFPAAALALPLDLGDAVSRMVYTRYAERQRDPLVKSEYVDGVGRTEYLTPSNDSNLSPDVADILDNYRVPVVG